MEDQVNKSPESSQILAAIISAARRRAGIGALGDGALAEEIRDWMRILGTIPAHRLQACNDKAMRERQVKGLLQPAELLHAYESIRLNETSRGHPSLQSQNGRPCYYCENTGWQTLLIPSESGALNSHARACSCAYAPLSMRSEFPFREPHWQRDEFGRWISITAS